jgi:MFS transporter, FHS family, glucose/mannose:H+ symporter
VAVPLSAPPLQVDGLHQASLARKGLSGFLLSGLLVSLLGTLLPAWGYHVQTNFLLIGTYFLIQGVGFVTGVSCSGRLLRRKGIGFGLALGCALAAFGLLMLALFSPPSHYAGRLLGLFCIGAAAGLLNTAVFHAVSAAYSVDQGATTNLAGVLFGLGCLLSALVVSGTFYSYSVVVTLLLIALLPAAYGVFYSRVTFPDDPVHDQPTWSQAMADFKSPAALLFALFLFFQFGNEWAIAGWLPLLLTLRLGISPATSLLLLALFWLALLLGRLAAQWFLPRVRHGLLLFAAVVAPLFACLILSTTKNVFGATVGILLAAGGFAVIYPLVVEKIRTRFPYFHPGFFNGIFSVAMLGGLLAPASIGYLAHFLGIGVVMGLPLLGTFMVLILLLLILLEARLAGTPGE